ncbi:OLC1v1005835C2 [Oldenlandia corymbosa var. corymbosa]|uniref:Lipoxygenase n=1 Tax=Oldenlandia corymbosa var. corymbosa TaxID=529605 RepID=A0AAV1DIY5_OLDCO|nr:OLC1v1005835C2 [Oldenlandia corymbosa var. corymbosa]
MVLIFITLELRFSTTLINLDFLQSYVPSETPSGLKRYRKKEIENLRGDGTGERKTWDRIYDYDVYNDLGDPDSNPDLARPVLGGNKQYPYPRRCRTGRPKSKKDPLSESRSNNVYVPRDEQFSEIKGGTFTTTTAYSLLHVIAPALEGIIENRDQGFPYFTEIDSLFNEGIHIPSVNETLFDVIPNLLKAMADTGNHVLLFETPQFVDRDKFGWLRDVEFSRQTLAGLNPCCIELVKEWPLKSKLDPKVYGPAESAITTELVEQQIKGVFTVEEALKQKKLFMLDYHDILLPYVERVRKQEGTTLYGSRTLFYLTPDNTLTPVAIELVCPPIDGRPQYKEVFTPTWSSTRMWLWKLARAHVLAHDSGIHQLVSHWLRTHCCTEPYIIASKRQLSEMHPIYRLLSPHFRYTMEINALARLRLINADGIIEQSFTPMKYSTELSAIAYDKLWRFDYQALPADLINRGMAEPDPTPEDPDNLKLTITDYPYANDGLLLWRYLREWVTAYVKHYYPKAESIKSDEELQAWWTEIRTVGHGDKKDEPWWPVLNTPEDLIGIVTTMIWVTSGHHAAVNFGQYDYAGYFPNRPTIARTTMPTEFPSEEKKKQFMRRPELELLTCFPSQLQATTVMAVLHILSSHSPDEEYLGDIIEPAWVTDPVIKSAFEKFQGRLKELEAEIDRRNIDENLRNRSGAGVVPYELLKPFSEKGVTAKGVPYSISI